MIVVSFDPAIHHLAYCAYDTELKDILLWDIVDLNPPPAKIVCDKCTAAAKFMGGETGLFCGKHTGGAIIWKKQILSHTAKELLAILNRSGHSDPDLTRLKKKDLVNYIHSNCKSMYTVSSKKNHIRKNNDIGFLHDSLYRFITSKEIADVLWHTDVVLIENQPVLKNPVMKSIQMFLYSMIRTIYGVGREAKLLDSVGRWIPSTDSVGRPDRHIDVRLLNATKKLETVNLVPDLDITKANYKDRKESSIIIARRLVPSEKWLKFLDDKKKADDLADTFLMNMYYAYMT